jgi:23S rRNA (adenine2030-N6)-methyltransferase
MNYRHAFHAGNFADVIKHAALVAVLGHLARKDKGFCVIDTHAGAGLYDLGSNEAARTGEAQSGIARIGGTTDVAAWPTTLATWRDCVGREGPQRYPGSPRIAARLLRPQDRLFAIEKHPEDAALLRSALAGFPNARAVQADGWERLLALLPPKERRGVVLIDPPYEEADEFARVADGLARAHRHFANGIYIVWYPIKSRAESEAFLGEVKTRIATPQVRIEIDVGRTDDERLSAAGILIINPPYGFVSEMERVASFVAPRLGRDPAQPASITIAPPSLESRQ